MTYVQSIAVGLFVGIVCWYLNYTWNRRRLYELASKIPGPKGVPLFGYALELMGKNNQELFNIVMKLSKEGGDIVRVWLGPKCFVILNSVEDLQIVANSADCLEKSKVYRLIPVRNGLVTAKVDVWRVHRKLLNSTFNFRLLQSFTPDFNEKSRKLIKILDKLDGKAEFDAFHIMSTYTLEALFSSLLGLTKDFQNDPNNQYLYNLKVGAAILIERLCKVWLHSDLIFKCTKLYRLQKKHLIEGVFKGGESMITEQDSSIFAEIDVNAGIDENGNDISGPVDFKTPRILIEQLKEMKKVVPIQDIKDEINTFMAAGHETTALTMSGALLFLAMHPEAQEKVVQELNSVFETAEETVENDHLIELVYLEMVIKETMRLLPVLPIIGRCTTAEVQLTNNTLPDNVSIIVPTFNIQRNPKYWGEDADKFNPDRFLLENFAKVPTFAYFPFGVGPRICIGMKYAMNIMKINLAHFLRNYKVNTSLKYEELAFHFSLSIKIVQNNMISIEKRVHNEAKSI